MEDFIIRRAEEKDVPALEKIENRLARLTR